jgi:hypothetical protein
MHVASRWLMGLSRGRLGPAMYAHACRMGLEGSPVIATTHVFAPASAQLDEASAAERFSGNG